MNDEGRLARRAAVSRRAALRGLAAAGVGAAVYRIPIRAVAAAPPTRFGAIADVHQDIIHDAPMRIGAFVEAMRAAKADFIIQLGDFCQPLETNRAFLSAWNTFNGPRYHVLGNHDMDGGATRERTTAFYGMPGRHYTFDAGGFVGIVLDANEPGGKAVGYFRFVGAEQLGWLERTLASATKPALVFIHQPLDDPGGVENAADVRAVLERAGPGRVMGTIAGHLHLDYVRVIGGLPYVQINSASYFWLGDAGKSTAYLPAEAHAARRMLQYVAAYRDPLWALVDVDPAAGEMRIQGRATSWIGPSAPERAAMAPTQRNVEHIRPAISSRRVATGR